jgi:hypothetical protein
VTLATKATPAPDWFGGSQATGSSLKKGAKASSATPDWFGATPVKAKKVAPKADPLGPVMSFGQGVLDTLMTPMYGVQGLVRGYGSLASEIGKGQFDLLDLARPVTSGWENATSWMVGKRPVTTFDLLKNINVIGGKGALVQETKSTGDFWKDLTQPDKLLALAGDILLDPTSYVGLGLITKPLKAASIAGKTGIEAAKMANAGKIATEALNWSRPLTEAQASKVSNVPIKTLFGKELSSSDKYKFKLLDEARIKAAEGNAPLTKLQQTQLKIAQTKAGLKTGIAPGGKYAIEVADVGASSELVNANRTVLSAILGAKKGFAASLLSDKATRSLEKLSVTERKLIKRTTKEAIKTGNALPAVIIDTAGTAGKQTVKMADDSIKEVSPNTIFEGPNGEISVFDGKYVHQFDTTENATQWLKNKKVEESTITFEKGIPATDSPAHEWLQRMARAGNVSGDVKEVSGVLDAVNKVAKRISKPSDVARIIERVSTVVKEFSPEAAVTARSLSEATKKNIELAIAGKEYSPLLFFRDLAKSPLPEKRNLWETIKDTTITGGNGISIPLREAIKQQKISATAEQSLLTALIRIQTAGEKPSAILEQQLKAIEAITGKAVADEIKTSKALEAGKDVPSALKAVLEKSTNLKTGGKYAGIDDLISGIRNGDTITLGGLERIIKALDPESKLEAKLAEAMADKTGVALRNLFLGDGVQTYQALRDKFNILSPDQVITGTGMSFSTVLAKYFVGRLSGQIEADPRIADVYMESVITDLSRIDREGSALEKKRLNAGLAALSTAVDWRAGEINALLKDPNLVKTVSTIRDVTMRNTEDQFQDVTHAIIPLKQNQSYEARLASSVASIIRSRRAKALTSKNEKSDVLLSEIEADLSDPLVEFARTMALADDAQYALLKNRVTIQKFVRNTPGKGAEKLKEKHYAYFHSGDIVDAFLKTGNPEFRTALEEAFFPALAGTKTQTLEWISLSETFRMMLEASEKGATVSHDALVERLGYITGSRVESGKVGKQFYEDRMILASRIIDAVESDPSIFEHVKSQHLAKATGFIEDANTQVMGMAENVMEELVTAQRLNSAGHGLTSGERVALINEAFQKFVYLGNFLDKGGSDVASSMLKMAAAIFLKDGSIMDAKVNKKVISKLLPTDTKEMENIVVEMQGYFKHVKPEEVVPKGREGYPIPTQAAKENAQNKFFEAKRLYEEHVTAGWATVTNSRELGVWRTKYKKLQEKLDKTRLTAWEKYNDVEYWDNGKWVPSDRYNHAASVRRAQKSPERVQMIDGRQIDRAQAMVDNPPVKPTKKLDARASAAYVKKVNKALHARAAEIGVVDMEDGATRALAREQEMVDAGLDGYDLAVRMYYEQIMHAFEPKGVMPVDSLMVSGEYGAKMPSPVTVAEQRAMGTTIDQSSFGWNTRERLMGAGGREQTNPLLIAHQSTILRGEAQVSAFIIRFRRAAIKGGIKTREDQIKLFQDARSGADLSQFGAEYQNLAGTFGKWINQLEAMLKESNVTSNLFENSLKKFGLSEKQGIVIDSKKKLSEILDELPFGENPYDKAVDPEGWGAWNTRQKAFAASEFDPLEFMSRIAFAHAQAEGLNTFVGNLIANHGFKAYGYNQAKASAEGMVALKAYPDQGGIGSDLIKLLEAQAGNGAMFPPEIAREIGSIARELDYLGAKKMPDWLNTVGQITGVIKATQTILGDFTSAMIRGTRDPRDWMAATRMAFAIAKRNARVDYGGATLEQQMMQSMATLSRVSKNPKQSAIESMKFMQNAKIAVVLGGKKVEYSFEDFAKLCEDNDIAVESIVANDIQGMVETLQTRIGETGVGPTGGPESVKASQRMQYHLNRGYEKVVKVPGDFTAAYSNIPRIAHALSIARNKSFGSEAEMFAEISRSVHMYHPTMMSLSATERKTIRPFIT